MTRGRDLGMARRSPRLALGTCSVLVSALACLVHPAPAMGPHDESEAHPCVLHVLHPQNMSRPARRATSIVVRSVSKCACVVLVHICTRPWTMLLGQSGHCWHGSFHCPTLPLTPAPTATNLRRLVAEHVPAARRRQDQQSRYKPAQARKSWFRHNDARLPLPILLQAASWRPART